MNVYSSHLQEYQCVYCAHKFDQEQLLEDHLDYVHNDTEANHLEQINNYGLGSGSGGGGISPESSETETRDSPGKRKPRTCQRSQVIIFIVNKDRTGPRPAA